MGDSTIPSKNPTIRRKVASVQKGFALHDWSRLLSCSKDLAQRKGAPLRDISLKELSQHSSPLDGWIGLHGKVYNIGPYLPYHPGGTNIMLPCLGKDASTLFEKYHRWVNIDRLVGPLLIGYLVVDSSNERKEENRIDKNRSLDEEHLFDKTLDGEKNMNSVISPDQVISSLLDALNDDIDCGHGTKPSS